MRFYQPYAGGTSAVFAMLNAGKTCREIDIKTDAGRPQATELLKRADVLVEQFRPGVMARLGLGYENVRTINPRLIYCSISGYGQAGPRAQEAGHDLNYIGNTGLLALAPGVAAPTVPPALVADIAGGSFPAVMNILLALRQRDATGQGCYLDIAMTDAMFTFAWHALASGIGGKLPEPGEGMLTGGSPRYQVYRAKDGGLIACAALEQKFWQTFCGAIGLVGPLASDLADPTATRDAVAAIIATKTADEWRPIFAAADCCVTVVVSLEEALADPHFVARGLFSRREGAVVPDLPLPIAPIFRAKPKTKS
jgi:crotonobetainyl-CoA:carnitine CoA-transferase CaiB-like acyl-CoA transferase